MPQETRNYVLAITGSTVEDWAKAQKGGKMPERMPTSSCRELMALLKRAPNPFITGLEQRITLSAAKLWGVQLAAGFSRDKALAMYARAMKRLSAVIGDQDPSLLSSVMRSRGTRAFYQVRIGADTRPAADDLCNRIRQAGGACFVLKNRGVPGMEESFRVIASAAKQSVLFSGARHGLLRSLTNDGRICCLPCMTALSGACLTRAAFASPMPATTQTSPGHPWRYLRSDFSEMAKPLARLRMGHALGRDHRAGAGAVCDLSRHRRAGP